MLEEAGLLEDTSMLGENSMLEDSSIIDSSAMEDSGMINSSINNSTLNTGDEVRCGDFRSLTLTDAVFRVRGRSGSGKV
jgi:hypothetical protein